MENFEKQFSQPKPSEDKKEMPTPKLEIDKQKEDEGFFEKLKRPYGVEDVKNLQQALLEFEEKRKKENGKYVFDYNNFYQFLTSFSKKEFRNIIPNEKEIPIKDYEELELGIFQGWRQNLLQNQEQVLQKRPKLAEVIKTLQNEPSPKTLDDLRGLYQRYPLLNDMSAVSYQEGVGEKLEKRSGFLHINMARYYAYKYEMPEADTRIYLNPPVEAIPKLSMHLVGLAEKEKIPLYFKVIDYSFQKFAAENTNRLDKMLIYTDKKNTPKLAKIIKELQSKKPQWFQGRELPNLVAPIGEGVGMAAEPSEFQKQKFGERGKSFNSIRALFMKEVWRDTTKDILLANKDTKPRRGRTFQQIFNDQFKLSLDYLKLDNETINRYIDQVWQAGLDAEKLSQEIKAKVSGNLESALLRTMQDVVPNITPDSLATWIDKRVQEKATQYGINPKNIALNK
ncbi:MAG: T3SS effector HopA1 family protein [Candidatus Pacebacteria bacterium]|nr:T3SS effector HopA1 family protein [Candidatus Paceibacterota bacterium]